MQAASPDHRIRDGVLQPANFPPLPDTWTSEWETFPGAGLSPPNLFMVTYHRKGTDWKNPRALFIVHGMGEHGGRYLHFPHYLDGTVESVSMVDLRGHGRSEGLRGHVEAFDLFAGDVAIAVRRLDDQLKRKFGRSEIHFLGHSLGGLIALRTLFLYPDLPLRSATISAPVLGIRVAVPPLKKAAALVLSKTWSSLHMTSEVNPADLSHDREVERAYRADRLVHSKITPGFFSELQAAIADTNRRDSGMNYPIQMLVPLEDRLVDPERALEFFRALQAKEKLLHTYPSFFHESFNEIGKEKVFEDLKSWINAH